MRILLTGGTGLIGRALCRHWHEQGHELIVWSRSPQRVPSLCSGARGIGRLRDLDGAAPLDAVVNLAGASIAGRPWTASRRKVLWSSRVDLTRELVAWLGDQPSRPAVLLSGSAVGWYGDGEQRHLDENSPASRADFGSKLCVAWEQEAERARQLDMRVVLIRTAPVLAPQGGFLARLRLPFSLGLGGRLGRGEQWMPWIHLEDEVGLIDFLLQREDCVDPYNACAPQQVRNVEFTQALAQALRRPAVLPVPAWALRLALGDMSVLLLGGQRLAPRRALEAGYPFRHPRLDEALADVLHRTGK
ncbi:TIGR01777 family protein [Verticiella sediminum]|uniref:TIGR01777 family protein n=1 Tax=Verticiella sediminum TaxID=1247510 RepID=A0A556B1A4_9BURK|nr:TIGR01777 family oxidoreductase [Verticiella sediminum]TSH98977.1 TIGR01777 family protein [Verticiella sediminum]